LLASSEKHGTGTGKTLRSVNRADSIGPLKQDHSQQLAAESNSDLIHGSRCLTDEFKLPLPP